MITKDQEWCFIRRRRFDLIRCNSRKLDYSFPRVVNRTTITVFFIEFQTFSFLRSLRSNGSPKSFKFLLIIFPKIPPNIFNLFNIVGLLFLSYLLQFSRNSSRSSFSFPFSARSLSFIPELAIFTDSSPKRPSQ